MNLNIVLLSFLGLPASPLNVFFGWLTRVFLDFFGSYGLAIIALTILIRSLLIPLNVRSQRSMIKQQALSAQQAEIRRKYPNDKQKQNEEITKLLQQNGAASFGGCLLPLVQLFFLWPIFAVVRAPLRYIGQVSSENLLALGDMIGVKNADTFNVPIIKEFIANPDFLREAIQKGLISMQQVIDMKFLGLDLSLTPQYQPAILFGENSSIYLPLLIIPLLVLITTLIQTRLTNMLKPNRKMEKEAKEAKARAKVNPARQGQGQEGSMASSMKMMVWLMPVIMLVTTFAMPAAMGFYWIFGNIMGVLQQVIIFFLFTRPLEEKKAEMEMKKAMAFARNAGSSSEELPPSGKGKKRK